MKNSLLYNASMALIEASKFVRPVDKEYAIQLLDKAQEFKDLIVIDEDLEAEVKDFEQEIKKRM